MVVVLLYATDYNTSKIMLLYEAELLYNQMIEESVNMCSIDDITNNTLDLLRLLFTYS